MSKPIPTIRVKTMLREAAYHEAGHAVVAWLNGFKILRVSIRPGTFKMTPRGRRYKNGGNTAIEFSMPEIPAFLPALATRRVRAFARRRIQVLQAGGIATWRYFGKHPHIIATISDERKAFEVAESLFSTHARRGRFIDGQIAKTFGLVYRGWPAVTALAKRLLKDRELKGAEAVRVIEAAAPPRRSCYQRSIDSGRAGYRR